MVKIDENKEALACIQMTVNDYDKAMATPPGEDPKDVPRGVRAAAEERGHWKLGSPDKQTTTHQVEQDLGLSGIKFHKRVREYLQLLVSTEEVIGTTVKV
jgi:response regulator of citrate/malate metabolism